MINDAVVYQANRPIAGVLPRFILPNHEMAEYFDNCGGAPEADLIAWATQFLPPYGRFVDIGSHCGTWSVTMGAARNADVVAFEAQAWLARLTRAGMALNDCNGVVHNVALSDTKGSTTMRLPKAVNYSTLTASISGGELIETGGASIMDNNHVIEEQGFIEIEVETRLLDSFWLEPDLIKIDVEGAELKVLRGAEITIAEHKPTILVECWQDERGQNKEELFRYLHDGLDYRSTQIDGWPEMHLCEPI